MRIKSPVVLNVIRTLYLSLGMDLSLRLARDFIEGYNVNERMGFPPSVPVPVQDAVNRIVLDLNDAGLFIELVEWLVRADRHGFRGKQYNIAGIDEIIKGMEFEGFLLDPESELFYEDPRKQRSQGWGRLKVGQEYPITLLRVDIVSNSRLVRNNSEENIAFAYDSLRELITRIVEKRRGRLWLWEGDGGLAAFSYGHPNMSAVLCGMELLNELLVYNLSLNPLDRPLQIRAAAHAGFIPYSEDSSEIQRAEIVKEIVEIEARYTKADSLSVSASIAPHVDGIIKDCFVALGNDCPREILSYSIRLCAPAQRNGKAKAAWK